MANNFGQEVVYRLRDLGYYGEFNERDVTRICATQPKLKHLFMFMRDELDPKEHLLSQAELEEERSCAKLTGNMLASQVAEKAREKTIESILRLPDQMKVDDAEIDTLAREIEMLEKQLMISERQENLLQFESKDLDHKIEALDTASVKEVSEIEDLVNSRAAKTYREVQQSLEAVTFALETSLQQLFKLSQQSTRPEEQATKQLLGEFLDKVLSVRVTSLKQVIGDIVNQVS